MRATDIINVRGTRDYFGGDLKKLEFIKKIFETTAQNFGYEKIEFPVIEYFELFAKKSGEEIRNTMYTFIDKAGRELALRPEMTPSAVRAYLNHFQHYPKPVRLYYYGTVYRYDEPQFGRYREFRQAGIELIGASGVLADLEVILFLLEVYRKLNLLDKIKLKINNIGIYRKLFKCGNIDEDKQEHMLHLIDKGRVDEVLELLKDNKIYGVIEALLSRSNKDQIIDESRKIGCDVSDEINYLEDLLGFLSHVRQTVYPDIGFVRGLAYYTGVIFEVLHPDVSFSIAGGGRYDGLVEIYGGSPTPAVGFAIGVERTSLVLPEMKEEPKQKVAVIILSKSAEALRLATELISGLHELGVEANFSLKGTASLSKLIPELLKEGYTHLAIIGEKEISNSSVSVKDLMKRTQTEIRLPLTVDNLRQIF